MKLPNFLVAFFFALIVLFPLQKAHAFTMPQPLSAEEKARIQEAGRQKAIENGAIPNDTGSLFIPTFTPIPTVTLTPSPIPTIKTYKPIPTIAAPAQTGIMTSNVFIRTFVVITLFGLLVGHIYLKRDTLPKGKAQEMLKSASIIGGITLIIILLSGNRQTVTPAKKQIINITMPPTIFVPSPNIKFNTTITPRQDFSAQKYYYQGLDIWTQSRDYEKAFAYYKKALEVDPNYAPALSSYGFIWGTFYNHPTEGEAMIRKAMKIDPTWAYAPLNLGLLLDSNGNHTEGEYWVQYAVDNYPNHPDIEHFKDMLRTMKEYNRGE